VYSIMQSHGEAHRIVSNCWSFVLIYSLVPFDAIIESVLSLLSTQQICYGGCSFPFFSMMLFVAFARAEAQTGGWSTNNALR
jgi:hypothetical protein